MSKRDQALRIKAASAEAFERFIASLYEETSDRKRVWKDGSRLAAAIRDGVAGEEVIQQLLEEGGAHARRVTAYVIGERLADLDRDGTILARLRGDEDAWVRDAAQRTTRFLTWVKEQEPGAAQEARFADWLKAKRAEAAPWPWDEPPWLTATYFGFMDPAIFHLCDKVWDMRRQIQIAAIPQIDAGPAHRGAPAHFEIFNGARREAYGAVDRVEATQSWIAFHIVEAAVPQIGASRVTASLELHAQKPEEALICLQAVCEMAALPLTRS